MRLLKKQMIGCAVAGAMLSTLTLRAEEGATQKKDRTAARQSAGPVDKETCIQEASKMNTATIQFGQLAAQKAQNPQLKRFGQTLEQDHRKAQTELESIAKKHNVTLQTTLEPKCQEEMTRLQGLSGSEFDKEFAKGAIEGHAMALAHVEKGSKEVQDADLSQYTRNMTAKLRDHQRQAREIARAVGVDQATITSLENKAQQEAVGSPGATTTETSTEKSKDSEQPK
jgi:putative membrane protein